MSGSDVAACADGLRDDVALHALDAVADDGHEWGLNPLGWGVKSRNMRETGCMLASGIGVGSCT